PSTCWSAPSWNGANRRACNMIGSSPTRSGIGSKTPASRSPTPATAHSGHWNPMAGNSQRRGAIRKTSKKAPTVGSGGQRRRGLEGRGATPPAHMGPNHPAAKRAKVQARRPAKRKDDAAETVLGRNPVLECLRAGVPATALYVALGAQADERLSESVTLAADSGIAILEVPRTDLDRMTTNGLHQGIALQVPPYNYLHPDDLLKRALNNPPALLVALDNISDPRNLGAIVRSVAAFGGHGVLIPERRSASVTAVA